MRSIFKPVVIIALGAATLAACDRGPTGLSAHDVDALLSASGIAASNAKTGSTLPSLFRESIHAIEKVQGQRGVEALLSDWRRLQDELKADAATAGRSAIEAKLAQIHAEELRIVRSVLGNEGIVRLVGETNAGLGAATLSIEAARNAGRDVGRARVLAQQISNKLAATDQALTAKSPLQALDYAAEAAGTLVSLKHHLLDLQRVEGIETLYPRVVDKVRQERGEAAARMLTSKFDILSARSRAALRSGDREAAHASLALVRAEQIHIVEQVLGSGAADRLLEQVGSRAEEIGAMLKSLERSGRDVFKQQRMLREAVDLQKRADEALAADDVTTALDLGSHAAGLLNTLQHLTWY